jgi:hypothetical protein
MRDELADRCSKDILVVRIGMERPHENKRGVLSQTTAATGIVFNVNSVVQIIDPEANLIVVAPIAVLGIPVPCRNARVTRKHMDHCAPRSPNRHVPVTSGRKPKGSPRLI